MQQPIEAVVPIQDTLRKREARMRLVHEASLAITAPLDREHVLAEIVNRCARLLDGAATLLYLMSGSGSILERVAGSHIGVGHAGIVLAHGEGLASRAAASGRTIQIEDAVDEVEKLERFGSDRRLAGLVAIPLIYSGDVLGVLEVGLPRRGPLSPDEIEGLEIIASHAAVAIAHARLFERSREMLNLMQGINDRSAAVSSIAQAILDARFDLHRMLADALQRILSLLGLKAGSVFLSNPLGGDLHVVVHYRFPQDDGVLAPQQRLDHDSLGLAGRAAAGRQSIVIPDVEQDELTRPALDRLRRFGLGALVALPLSADDDVVGVLMLGGENAQSLEAGTLDALRVIAGELAQGVAHARVYSRVRADQEQFKAVISSSGDVVLGLDRLGRVTLANEAAQRAFGFEFEAVSGQSVSRITTNVALNSAIEQAARAEQRERIGFEVPLADDSVLFCNLSPITAEDGQLLGWVAVMQDVTRFKETERMKSDMILTASHDLRNPVNLTLGALDMLGQNTKNWSPTQREVYDLAVLGVRRIESLITDLLDLERVERRVGLQQRDCDLAEIAHTVITENRMQAQSKHQLLEADLPADLPRVWGDSQRLYQVVANLVSNAIKYTPNGGRITVTLRPDLDRVRLDVTDTGRGISQEAQARIFERFYRVAGSAAIDATGTGLGLALVKSIVEQHGGRVWVTSQLGHGSTFSASLPIWRAPDGEVAT